MSLVDCACAWHRKIYRLLGPSNVGSISCDDDVPMDLSVANSRSGGDGQLVQASAVTLPAVRIQIRDIGPYLRISFTGSVTVQRIMATPVVVELFKAEKLVLQVASSPKKHEVEVLSPDRPDQSFHKRMRNR